MARVLAVVLDSVDEADLEERIGGAELPNSLRSGGWARGPRWRRPGVSLGAAVAGLRDGSGTPAVAIVPEGGAPPEPSTRLRHSLGPYAVTGANSRPQDGPRLDVIDA
jgi:hypothetical protein